MTFDPIDLAQTFADAPAFERAVLDGLADTIGFDAAFFAVPGAPPTTVSLDASKLARAVAAHAYDHEIAPVKHAALAARGVAIDTEVLGEEAVARTRYHRDLAAPIGGRHSLFAVLVVRGRRLGALMLGRAGDFSTHEVEIVESLLGPLAVARASYPTPWVGPTLPEPRESLAARAIAWARGERVLADVPDGDRGRILVRDRAGFREMVARSEGAEFVWSRAVREDPRRSGWFYVELFHLAAARASTRRRALFLGCGGGVGVRQFAEVYDGISIDVVEVDPRVVDLANDFFALGAVPNLAVHIADAAEFLANAPCARWDVVVVDAFAGARLPPCVASAAFFGDIARVLTPGGALAFNTVGALGEPSAVHDVERLARAELDDVRLVPVLDAGEAYSPTSIRNVVVLASRRAATERGGHGRRRR